MKQRDLIKKLEKAGYRFKRPGGNHDIYSNGIDDVAVPRHKEVKESLARDILRKRGLLWKRNIQLFWKKIKLADIL